MKFQTVTYEYCPNGYTFDVNLHIRKKSPGGLFPNENGIHFWIKRCSSSQVYTVTYCENLSQLYGYKRKTIGKFREEKTGNFGKRPNPASRRFSIPVHSRPDDFQSRSLPLPIGIDPFPSHPEFFPSHIQPWFLDSKISKYSRFFRLEIPLNLNVKKKLVWKFFGANGTWEIIRFNFCV